MATFHETFLESSEVAPKAPKQDWVGDNLVTPFYNASVVQTANTAANIVNRTVKDGLVPKLQLTETKPPEGPAEVLGQGLAGGIGSILPYALASKAVGGFLKGIGRGLALEGAAARVVASESAAQILGAAAVDGFRDTHHGETQLGNVLGGVAAFGAFSAGNDLIRHTRMPLADAIVFRGVIGGVGAVTQLHVSAAISGVEVTGADVARAAVHGGIFNIGLHAAHVGANKAIDSVNAKLGRGVPVERFAQAQGLLGISPTLEALLYENPLARVIPTRGTSQADHGRQTVTINVDGNVAGKLGHELAHLTVRRSHEGLDRAAALLNDGLVQESKQAYMGARRHEENLANAFGDTVAAESWAAGTAEGGAGSMTPAGRICSTRHFLKESGSNLSKAMVAIGLPWISTTT